MQTSASLREVRPQILTKGIAGWGLRGKSGIEGYFSLRLKRRAGNEG
jgi:hypothetical protein